ncbi:hypothetical protein KJ682_03880 [bacterium]|nr:hypothetical protein [bacterium]
MTTPPGHLVLNLISDREPNIAKALRFGKRFLAGGWDVTLSINVDGVVLLDPGARLGPCPVTGKPLRAILDEFMEEGGRVLVGPECLKLAGLGPDCLAGSMVPADPALWQELLTRPGTVVFTY